MRRAAALGQRHALVTLARDHGALGQIRHWPGRRDLHCDVRGLNDHDLLRVVEQDVASHRLLIVEVADAVTPVHVPPPAAARPVIASRPAGMTMTPQQEKDAAVAAMDGMDKVLAALQRSGKHMGPQLGNAFAQLFTADNLKILAAFIIAGAIANTNPVSAAVFDSAMLIMVYYQAGSAGIHALELLVRTTMAVLGAKGDADLERAGEGYAKAFVGLGGAVFLAWLARRIIREKNTAGGSSGSSAAGDASGAAASGRNMATGPYKQMTSDLKGTGQQANHLNQDAAFRDIIPRDEGLANGIEGNAFKDVGTPHYEFHSSLEKFWDPYRKGGDLFGMKPSGAEYDAAVRQALASAGYTPAEAAQIARQAAAQRAAFGLGPTSPVPRIPGRLPQVK